MADGIQLPQQVRGHPQPAPVLQGRKQSREHQFPTGGLHGEPRDRLRAASPVPDRAFEQIRGPDTRVRLLGTQIHGVGLQSLLQTRQRRRIAGLPAGEQHMAPGQALRKSCWMIGLGCARAACGRVARCCTAYGPDPAGKGRGGHLSLRLTQTGLAIEDPRNGASSPWAVSSCRKTRAPSTRGRRSFCPVSRMAVHAEHPTPRTFTERSVGHHHPITVAEHLFGVVREDRR